MLKPLSIVVVLLSTTGGIAAASTRPAPGPSVAPGVQVPQHLDPVPAFWVCMRFYSELGLGLRHRAIVAFDTGAPATDDSDVAIARMREVREKGGEWLPGPLPLPHGVPASRLLEVWVDRYDPDTATVCGSGAAGGGRLSSPPAVAGTPRIRR